LAQDLPAQKYDTEVDMLKQNKLSIASRGLKYKLRIAFYLMAILPLLVCMYLVSTYILPAVGLKFDIGASVLISAFIAAAGFFVLKEVFDRILSVSTEAKLIASGDIDRRLQIKEDDEVGVLGESLNQLTDRIRSNMNELKNYSEKTTEINIEIQKRVIVLSSLLQISSLISQGANLTDILNLAVEKSRLLANSEMAYLLFREEGQEIFSVKTVDGANSDYLLKVNLWPKEELFTKAIIANKPLIIDKQNILPPNLSAAFYEKFKLKNTLAVLVYLRGRIIAILGIGNNQESYSYKKDDAELVDIFAKQVAIAVENDILMHRVEKLEIKDALTGLYNAVFMRSRLQEEIKRAITYQRPCAFILFDIDNFKDYYENSGLLQAEATLKKIASLVRDSVTEVDRAGRMGDDEFAVILPEKNKRRAQEIAEDIRKKVEFAYSEEKDAHKKITVSVGVSENPLDGIEAQELIDKARGLVELAKKEGKNRTIAFEGS
jgi:diguanylate cyclase (GGDEF)-like protein